MGGDSNRGHDGGTERLTDKRVAELLDALEGDDETFLRVIGDAGDVGDDLHSALSELRERRQDDEPVVGENLVARVQHARMLLDKGDQTELIAYLLDRSVDDVRKVVGE